MHWHTEPEYACADPAKTHAIEVLFARLQMFKDSTTRFEVLSVVITGLEKAKCLADRAEKKKKMEADIAKKAKLAAELKTKAEEAAAASLAEATALEKMQQELEAMDQDPIFVSIFNFF